MAVATAALLLLLGFSACWLLRLRALPLLLLPAPPLAPPLPLLFFLLLPAICAAVAVLLSARRCCSDSIRDDPFGLCAAFGIFVLGSVSFRSAANGRTRKQRAAHSQPNQSTTTLSTRSAPTREGRAGSARAGRGGATGSDWRPAARAALARRSGRRPASSAVADGAALRNSNGRANRLICTSLTSQTHFFLPCFAWLQSALLPVPSPRPSLSSPDRLLRVCGRVALLPSRAARLAVRHARSLSHTVPANHFHRPPCPARHRACHSQARRKAAVSSIRPVRPPRSATATARPRPSRRPRRCGTRHRTPQRWPWWQTSHRPYRRRWPHPPLRWLTGGPRQQRNMRRRRRSDLTSLPAALVAAVWWLLRCTTVPVTDSGRG